MIRRAFLKWVLIVALSPIAGLAETPSIPAVEKVVRAAVAAGEVAGAVTIVAERDRDVHLSALGHADLGKKNAMAPDSIFWIASMSKPVTGTAVMMMAEAGKLSLDDPVSRHLPEFGKLKNRDGEAVEVTIRQILAHTSGLSDLSGPESRNLRTLEGLAPLVVGKPVKFRPDSKWSYCQSGINTAARIVEVTSGQSFPEFLEERIFKPLGMKDTTFYLTEEQLPRLARSYRRTAAGQLEEAEIFILFGKGPTSRDRYPMANGGLFSTGPDYVRFCRMVLRDGELDGVRILKPESVRKMTSLMSGQNRTGFTPGNGWGVGWCLVREPQGVSAALSPGSFGHGGAYGTQAWIDPVKGRAYVLMVQRANFRNSDNSDLRREFQNAAARHLEAR